MLEVTHPGPADLREIRLVAELGRQRESERASEREREREMFIEGGNRAPVVEATHSHMGIVLGSDRLLLNWQGRLGGISIIITNLGASAACDQRGEFFVDPDRPCAKECTGASAFGFIHSIETKSLAI